MEAVEGHIQQYFGKFENVFHELISPDIHVDILSLIHIFASVGSHRTDRRWISDLDL